MFNVNNLDPQPKAQLGSSLDLEGLKALVDESPVGFSWRYVSAPAAKAWTNDVITDAGILLVFKASNLIVLCELQSLNYQEPVGILRKKSSGWDGAFNFKNDTTANGGVTNIW